MNNVKVNFNWKIDFTTRVNFERTTLNNVEKYKLIMSNLPIGRYKKKKIWKYGLELSRSSDFTKILNREDVIIFNKYRGIIDEGKQSLMVTKGLGFNTKVLQGNEILYDNILKMVS